MLTKEQERSLLDSLERLVGVTDVYVHRGELVVLNDYDLELVEEFLDETGWAAEVGIHQPELNYQ